MFPATDTPRATDSMRLCAHCHQPYTWRPKSRFCSDSCRHSDRYLTHKRPKRSLPDHPLAPQSGCLVLARVVLYAKIGPGQHPCHWCGRALEWRNIHNFESWGTALIADHIDGDTSNNDPSNLAPSCNRCNSTRMR
jgi:hypothetical protein